MRHGWIWGTYVFSLAWVGFLFIRVDRFLSVSRAETFRQDGRRLVRLWADRIAEAGEAPQRSTLLRRFSGELDSRSVALLNEGGQSMECVGDPPPSPPRLPLSEPSDRPLDSRTWAYWSPLWVAGRRAGYLAWVRDATVLERDQAHTQRGLLAAWAWWAAAGAVAALFASRTKN